jgi:glucosylceramidase
MIRDRKTDSANEPLATRRQFVTALGSAATIAAVEPTIGAVPASTRGPRVSASGNDAGARWVCTTQQQPWQSRNGIQVGAPGADLFAMDLAISLDEPQQRIDGFGAAFTEKGWQALQTLPPAQRSVALDQLFKPGTGANLALCRTPVGANDISRGWYSYDETDGDFALEHFTVANDRDTLLPFIRAAAERQPELQVWASPWSPPTWMKSNRHYAMAKAWPGNADNGLRDDQRGMEGKDYFIQEDRYFDAYARYFRRYVEEYAKEGVRIFRVMPQNEFNSAQPFPSCCWTPAGLARFIPFLGRELGKVGVDIYFGTLERGNADLLTHVLNDPAAGPFVKGIGVQWAGKRALPVIRDRHPQLPVWQSEQECGVGTNDWHYVHYTWSLMKHYFNNGVSAWHYWNMAMPTGGMSGWGWPQNSLLTVDAGAGTWRLNPDYYLLAHASHFIKPGAHRLALASYFGYDNLLAFRNPDGELVLLLQNEMTEPLRIRIMIGQRLLTMTLPADSFNTVTLPDARS